MIFSQASKCYNNPQYHLISMENWIIRFVRNCSKKASKLLLISHEKFISLNGFDIAPNEE